MLSGMNRGTIEGLSGHRRAAPCTVRVSVSIGCRVASPRRLSVQLAPQGLEPLKRTGAEWWLHTFRALLVVLFERLPILTEVTAHEFGIATQGQHALVNRADVVDLVQRLLMHLDDVQRDA